MVELGELRVRLDQMTERIVSRFKDRSRFPLNEAIYLTNGVPITGRSNISLLQFAIEGLETYHATLGRYNYPDQYPVLGLDLPSSRVERSINNPSLSRLNINTSEGLLTFYQNLLSKHCDHKHDPNTYGQTAYIDADLLELIHERVNIGRYVAETKGFKDPIIYQLSAHNDLLLSKLKDKVREEALVSRARDIAKAYELDPEIAEQAFRWMIDKTLDIEIAYIQQVGVGNA
ncbi:MAG: chorismate mutase [Candidatus Daviesbacteria bacterium]|nr:chorismate mutase [Candidatus Daviesbacteria bacterium]